MSKLLNDFLRDRGRVFSTGFRASRPGFLPAKVSNSTYSPKQFRSLIRNAQFDGPTSGFCPGALQANVAVLPQPFAFDFLGFCLRNQRSCPLLFASHDPGSSSLEGVVQANEKADIRTDVPKYNVWRYGKLCEEGPRLDVVDIWKERGDWVTFLLGCSFTFENALSRNNLEPRNVSAGLNVSMYRTNIPTISSGIFGGAAAPLVVSMRPYKPHQVKHVTQITGSFTSAHGAPIHAGDPSALGISNLFEPDFGDSPHSYLQEDDVPVFWCCGVTPHSAILAAGEHVDVAITHAPGHMLVTDLEANEY